MPTDLVSAFNSIGLDRDYSALDLDGFDVELHGWGAPSPVFDKLLREVRPEVVIEVGTWNGASVLRMYEIVQELRLTTKFVCVDTWLGSNQSIWFAEDDRAQLRIRGHYPDQFRQFVHNLIAHGAEEDVFPLPMTSTTGARVLERLGVTADLVYIDAGHEEEEVASDIRLYYELLRPGGVMFGDDYHPRWPGVVRAVDRFRPRRRLLDGQWWGITREEPRPHG
jgi:predicted O-methyltransferase YrrM